MNSTDLILIACFLAQLTAGLLAQNWTLQAIRNRRSRRIP